MQKYVARRLLLFIPTLVGVSLVIFALMRIVPGDPALMILAGPTGEASYSQEDLENLRAELGLDRPLLVQYGVWLSDMVTLDLGQSFLRNRPVLDEVKARFPVTMQLAVLSLLINCLIALPIGVVAAVRQDTMVDYVFRSIAIAGLAMPTFWVGLIVVLVLSRYFNWFAPIGFVHLWQDPVKSLQQLFWPALALGFATSGLLMRMTRAQMLEVLREDYIRTAWAKGLLPRVVIVRHALRNALLPVVTLMGFVVATLFSGSVITEIIFNIPGMGRALIMAISTRDLPLIQAFILFIALLYLVINLGVDLLYGWLDPCIRYE